MTALDLTTYKALSFDCYGTLIDWEAGIAALLEPWAREHALDGGAEELLLAYGQQEVAVEAEMPAALYSAIIAHGLPAGRRDARRAGERSLATRISTVNGMADAKHSDDGSRV